MSELVEVMRDLRVSRSGHAAAFDSDTSRLVASAASWLAGSRSCRPRRSIISHAPRKSELLFTDDLGLAGQEPSMASLLEVPRCGHSPPSAWKLSLLTTGRLDRSWRTQPNEKGPAASLQRGRQSPLRWGWRDFLRKRVSAVLQGPAMEPQREKHPRTPPTLPKGNGASSRVCPPANQDGGRARFRRTATFRCLGIEPPIRGGIWLRWMRVS